MLRNRLYYLLRDSVVYGASAAVNKAFALITLPLLTGYFSVQEYGELDYIMVVNGLLVIFLIFGQDSAVARFYYEYKETDLRQQLISLSLIFQVFVMALFIPLIWISARYYLDITNKNNDEIIILLMIQLPFQLLINFSQNILKWTFSRNKFLLISLGSTATYTGFLICAISFFEVKIFGVLVVWLLNNILFGALGLILIRKWLVIPRGISPLREMVKFAIPYGVICCFGAFTPVLERMLVSNQLGADSLGLYALATKLAMLMGLIINSFQTSWGPFSLSLYAKPDAGATFNWVLKLFTLTACITALILTILSQYLILLLSSESYLGAVIVVFPLLMSLVVQATSWITEIGIGISKRSHLSLYAYISSIIFTLGSIWFFVPLFGLVGVGLGVLVGSIVKASTASLLAQKAFPLPWHYPPVLLVISITMIGGFLSIWFKQNCIELYGDLVLGFTILIVIIIGWLYLFSISERANIKRLLRQIIAN